MSTVPYLNEPDDIELAVVGGIQGGNTLLHQFTLHLGFSRTSYNEVQVHNK